VLFTNQILLVNIKLPMKWGLDMLLSLAAWLFLFVLCSCSRLAIFCIVLGSACCFLYLVSPFPLVGWNGLVLYPPYWQDPCHTLIHCPVMTVVPPGLSSSFIVIACELVFLEPTLFFHSWIFSASWADSTHQFQPSSYCPIYFWEPKEWVLHLKPWQCH